MVETRAYPTSMAICSWQPVPESLSPGSSGTPVSEQGMRTGFRHLGHDFRAFGACSTNRRFRNGCAGAPGRRRAMECDASLAQPREDIAKRGTRLVEDMAKRDSEASRRDKDNL